MPGRRALHAHRADEHGNVQYEPTILWPDIGIFPKAAQKVIVTAEEIVDSDVLRRNPDRTVLPGFRVDAVVEVPYGAHPTSFYPLYGYDTRFHVEWAKVARDDEQTQEFLRRYVLEPETQADYLDAVGGSARLMEVSRI